MLTLFRLAEFQKNLERRAVFHKRSNLHDRLNEGSIGGIQRDVVLGIATGYPSVATIDALLGDACQLLRLHSRSRFASVALERYRLNVIQADYYPSLNRHTLTCCLSYGMLGREARLVSMASTQL
jgi:hypothetical protein